MPIDFSAFTQLCARYRVAKKEFQPFLNNFLREMAQMAVDDIKGRTPVDTGALKGGWEVKRIFGDGTDLFAEIHNPMEYASFVEWGHRGVYVPSLGVTMHTDTHWTNGRFMMTIGIARIREAMPALFQQEFTKWAKGLGML